MTMNAIMTFTMKASLSMTLVAFLLPLVTTIASAGPTPTTLDVDLVIPRAEPSTGIVSLLTSTLDPATATASSTSFSAGQPSMINTPNLADTKPSMAKAILEYLFLSIAVLLVGSIIIRRLLALRAQNRPLYHFFYARDPSSPPHYTHHHAPGFAPQSLPPLPTSYLSSSHLTPPTSAYLGNGLTHPDRNTPPHATRRTTAADIDDSGRRGVVGSSLGANQEHDWDGWLTDRDALPAYDVFGGPPKYAEVVRNQRNNPHGGTVTEMTALRRVTTPSEAAAATATATTMSFVGIGAGQSRHGSSGDRVVTRHRARRSRRTVEGSDHGGDVSVSMSMSIVGIQPTRSVSSTERDHRGEELQQQNDQDQHGEGQSPHDIRREDGGQQQEQEQHTSSFPVPSSISAAPQHPESTAFASSDTQAPNRSRPIPTSSRSPELPLLSSPELISLPSPTFSSAHPTFLSRLLLPHDHDSISSSHSRSLSHSHTRPMIDSNSTQATGASGSHETHEVPRPKQQIEAETGKKGEDEHGTGSHSHSLNNNLDFSLGQNGQSQIPSSSFSQNQSQNPNIPSRSTHDASISTSFMGTTSTATSLMGTSSTTTSLTRTSAPSTTA
ncbi:hypothetical protein BDN72DRAFT_204507 [Pluteus cervinus]|uniref:Uncharacterized protein n=1 Tax=Pluteus cervinus TaxID=181527 RepID=A0ACD3AHY5_9AGAR|nr:hypothetical protein BDN72DRAFT_204507 [Pluteus cervinus]